MLDLEKILIKQDASILQSIQVIDQGAIGAALIVDPFRHLLGIVTDGDIRRAILKGISLEENVLSIMNKNPKKAYVEDSKENVLYCMRRFSIDHMPIVNEDNVISGLEVLNDFVAPEKYDNQVIIMAGGLGTRLRPLTENCPKPLLRVEDKPILEIILQKFVEQGFHNFTFSVNYRADMIEDYFGDGSKWHVNINYLHEDKPLGTAGALSLLSQKPKEKFIVMNGDIMTKIDFRHLLQFHQQQECQATLCIREYQHAVPYGVVNVEKNCLASLEEKPIQFYFVNAGIYVLEPQALDLLVENQHLDMTDLFKRMLAEQMNTAVFPIREYWADIGRMEDFTQASQAYQDFFA